MELGPLRPFIYTIIYIYTHTHIYIYTHTYIYIYTHTHTHTHTHTEGEIYRYRYIYIYIHKIYCWTVKIGSCVTIMATMMVKKPQAKFVYLTNIY